jgi:hypothetical protein
MESRYALQTLAHTQATEAEQKKKILRGVFQQNLLLNFLASRFVHLYTGTLNSTPELLARDRRAVAQGAQLGPGYLIGCEPRSQSDPGKDRD